MNEQRLGQWFYNKLFPHMEYPKPKDEKELREVVFLQRSMITDKLWNMSNKEFIEILLEYYND